MDSAGEEKEILIYSWLCMYYGMLWLGMLLLLLLLLHLLGGKLVEALRHLEPGDMRSGGVTGVRGWDMHVHCKAAVPPTTCSNAVQDNGRRSTPYVTLVRVVSKDLVA